MANTASSFKVKVACPECGDIRKVSPRQARRIRQGQYNSTCVPCQKGIPNPAYVRDAPTQEDRDFWLKRFSMAEIKEMAHYCFGDTAPHTASVTASAEIDKTP